MSEARYDSAWEGVDVRPADFGSYTDMVRLALDTALLGAGTEPNASAFNTVSAKVKLGAPAYRRLHDGVVLRQALTDPTRATETDVDRYRSDLAEVLQDGRPGLVVRTARKEVWFDGAATRLSVNAKQDRRYATEGEMLQFNIELARAFCSSDGIRLFRQILAGHSDADGSIKLLAWDRVLSFVGLSKDIFKGVEGRTAPKDKSWVAGIDTMFDPAPSVEVSQLGDWQRLFNEPLNTTHVLRNRGTAIAMPKTPEGQREYRWATSRDIGTEEGEMSVGDALELALHVIECADGVGQKPRADVFTLTHATGTLRDQAAGANGSESWSGIATKRVMTDDGE